jgi:phosphate transport system permease protein
VRKLKHTLFVGVTLTCAAIAFCTLMSIVTAISMRGLSAMSWQFFTDQMRLVGAAGGIFFNVVGTLILLVTALALSLPTAMGIGLLYGVYLKHSNYRPRILMSLHLLNSVPSILFGIFGLIVFVKTLGWGKSWLSGGVLLASMILPTVSLSLIERLEAIPPMYLEAAAGLGLNTSQIIWSVIVPQSLNGIISGQLLGLVRAAGETAPIMFTATVFAGATWPHGVRENPVLSLPYHIFVLSQDSFDPAIVDKLWGTALTVLLVVFCLSLAALPMRLRIYDRASPG